MAKLLRLLDQARVAAPCPAEWDSMAGDDRTRHCSMCRHNVYNLSDMTDREAENLLRNAKGRLCVRYYLRSDGKVMTKDCPRGLKALRQKMARQFVLVASLVFTALGCGENGEKIKKAFGLDKFQKPPVVMGKMPVPSTPPTCPPPPTSPPATMGMVGPSPTEMGEIALPDPVMGRVANPAKEPLAVR